MNWYSRRQLLCRPTQGFSHLVSSRVFDLWRRRAQIQVRTIGALLLLATLVGAALTRAQLGSRSSSPVVPVKLDVPTRGGESLVDLSWSATRSREFSEYRIYRATHSGVTVRDTLVDTIYDPAQITTTDERAFPAVAPGRKYFYRVFVFDAAGRSVGSNERTIVLVQTSRNFGKGNAGRSANSAGVQTLNVVQIGKNCAGGGLVTLFGPMPPENISWQIEVPHENGNQYDIADINQTGPLGWRVDATSNNTVCRVYPPSNAAVGFYNMQISGNSNGGSGGYVYGQFEIVDGGCVSPTPTPTPTLPPTPTPTPLPCGHWVHEAWTQTSTVTWTRDAYLHPVPDALPAEERLGWRDTCQGTTKPAVLASVAYSKTGDYISYTVGGTSGVRHVTYTATSSQPGDDGASATSIITGQAAVFRRWIPGNPIHGGLTIGNAGQPVYRGGSFNCQVNNAGDDDQWSVGSEYTGSEADALIYTWTCSLGGFVDGNNADGTPHLVPSKVGTSFITWVAPTEASGAASITCTLSNPTPRDLAPQLGSRQDDPVTLNASTQVVQRKTWSAGTPITVAPTPTGQPAPQVEVGYSLGVTVAATDPDHWVKDNQSGDENDALTYSWSAPTGTLTNATTDSPTWNVPWDTAPGLYNLTCTINDQPKQPGANEAGTRDDTGSKVVTLPMRVVRKVWSAAPQMTGGRMTAPQNQTVTPATPATIEVRAEGTLACAVESVTDLDTYTLGSEVHADQPDTVSYQWSGPGYFSDATARATQWYAWASGTVTLTCTIHDATPPPAGLEEGTRDDVDIVRSVTVEVVPWKQWNPYPSIYGGTVTGTTDAGQGGPPNDGGYYYGEGSGYGGTLYVLSEGTLSLHTSDATDQDSYTPHPYTGSGPFQEADELHYQWSGGGTWLGATDGQDAQWQAPALAVGEKSKTYTLKCTLNDLPKAVVWPDEGTRDDDASVREVTVIVYRKWWTPDYGIYGGEITSPYLYNYGYSSNAILKLVPGSLVPCQMEAGTDYDKWEVPWTSSYDTDDLRYEWSSTVGGTFRDMPPDSASQNDPTLLLRRRQWVVPAPNDGSALSGTLTGSVDDTPKAIVAPDGGERDDPPVTHSVPVQVVASKAGAKLRLYGESTDNNSGYYGYGSGNEMGAEILPAADGTWGALGGRVWVVLEIEVGPGRRLAPALLTGAVRVQEQLSDVPVEQLPLSRRRTDFDFRFDTGNGWEQQGGGYEEDYGYYGSGSGSEYWSDYSNSPQSANMSTAPVKYRVRWLWNSASQPMGHNVTHTISLAKLNGSDPDDVANVPELGFERLVAGEWSEAASVSVPSVSVPVRNLLLQNVQAKDGTQNDDGSDQTNADYFRFDPAPPADQTGLQHPSLSFEIVDEGSSHKYVWKVKVRGTDQNSWYQDSNTYYGSGGYGSGNAPGLLQISGRAEGPGVVTVPLNPQAAVAGQTRQGELGARGTYTFDIEVQEVYAFSSSDGYGSGSDYGYNYYGAGDSQSYRSRYLSIPQWMPNTYPSRPGHWVDVVEEAKAGAAGEPPTIEQVLKGNYALQETNTSTPQAASALQVDVLNPLLKVLAGEGQSALPLDLNIAHLNQKLYTLRGDDPSGTYIVLWQGLDGHGWEYRDLQPRRMVPVNQRPVIAAKNGPASTWGAPWSVPMPNTATPNTAEVTR